MSKRKDSSASSCDIVNTVNRPVNDGQTGVGGRYYNHYGLETQVPAGIFGGRSKRCTDATALLERVANGRGSRWWNTWGRFGAVVLVLVLSSMIVLYCVLFLNRG